jgi:hypothetical protein
MYLWLSFVIKGPHSCEAHQQRKSEQAAPVRPLVVIVHLLISRAANEFSSILAAILLKYSS